MNKLHDMILAFMVVRVTQSTMVWTLHGSKQMPSSKKYEGVSRFVNGFEK
jgi:hypothetical protein